MPKAEKFWNRLAARYEKSPISDPDAYARKLETTRQHFKPDARVLEFGCGTGKTAVLHAPHVGHYDAIDFSEEMLKFGQAEAEAAGLTNLTFTCADIDAFDAPAESYDVVLGLSILHLVDDRHATIARVYDLLRPGGVFISSTTCLGDFMRIMRVIGPIGRAVGLLPLLRVFTSAELLADFEAAGFDTEESWDHGKDKVLFVVARKPG